MAAISRLPGRTILLVFALVSAALFVTRPETGTAGTSGPIYVDGSGYAVAGHDPVAYFTDKKPVQGIDAHAYTWQGVKYRFASAANRNTFQKTPEKYAPQYGGYCAFGMTFGKKFEIDPRAWKVVDGKLYLNKNLEVQKMWEGDVPGYIAKADGLWPGVRDTPGK